MIFLEDKICKLYYGRYRRLFRAVANRITSHSKKVYTGPLKGARIVEIGLAHRLGIFELHVQRALQTLLHPGDVFYDVGANIGYISLLASRLAGAAGFVYAFEPLPENAQSVERLMSLNKISHYNLLTSAVSETSGMTQLFYEDTSNATPSLLRGGRNKTIHVKTLTLDDFARSHRSPNLVKVDVEGAEVNVLKGARELLSLPNAPIWIIEIHNEENSKSADSLLHRYGYEVRELAPLTHYEKSFPQHIIAVKR